MNLYKPNCFASLNSLVIINAIRKITKQVDNALPHPFLCFKHARVLSVVASLLLPPSSINILATTTTSLLNELDKSRAFANISQL